MNIAIIGYGKMGKEIERVALQRGHKIVLKTDSKRPLISGNLIEKMVDVAIEFTEPGSAESNIYKCFEANVPIVSGTTGWYLSLPHVKDECMKSNQAFFYASNFSIGVNIFFRLNEYLAKMMNDFEDYEPSLLEIHHTEKKDAPSGTALTLVEDMLMHLKRKEGWNDHESWDENEVRITSERKPNVPGTHQIKYESDDDLINLEHIAKGRTGFALGSVMAAEWLKGKKGVFTMSDMLKF